MTNKFTTRHKFALCGHSSLDVTLLSSRGHGCMLVFQMCSHLLKRKNGLLHCCRGCGNAMWQLQSGVIRDLTYFHAVKHRNVVGRFCLTGQPWAESDRFCPMGGNKILCAEIKFFGRKLLG